MTQSEIVGHAYQQGVDCYFEGWTDKKKNNFIDYLVTNFGNDALEAFKAGYFEAILRIA